MGIEVALAIIGTALSAYSAMQQADQAKEAKQDMQRSEQAMQRSEQQQRAAAEEQKAVTEQNAAREEIETAERTRRQEEQFKQEESLARARAAASGLVLDEDESGNSIALALGAQQRENARQLLYEKEAGASRASIIRRGGDVGYRTNLSRAEEMGVRAGEYGTRANAALAGIGPDLLKTGKKVYDWWSMPPEIGPSRNPGFDLDVA